MDAYNRGYDAGINDLSELSDGSVTFGGIKVIANLEDFDFDGAAQAASFYAIAYQVTDGSLIDGFDAGDVIISYRGTDGFLEDSANGFPVGAGQGRASQALLAADFYKSVVASTSSPGTQVADFTEAELRGSNVTLTGHSLGGGLAGLIGSVYGLNYSDNYNNNYYDLRC